MTSRDNIKKLIDKEIRERRTVLASALARRLRGHVERRQTEPYVIFDPNTPREVIHLAVEKVKEDHPQVQARHYTEGIYDKVQFLF